MKLRNPIYVGSPPEPDEDLLIQCTHCRVKSLSAEWRGNRGKCPACGKPYAGPKNEDL